MSIAERIYEVKQRIPPDVKLIAVSKLKSEEDILTAYQAGQRLFGENRIQELALKFTRLPKDIEWHAIGHLQTNKIKYIAPFVSMIHSVDSLKLLKAIDIEAQKNNRKINCLLQVHIAREETKYGFTAAELDELLKSNALSWLESIRICGLMGMATFSDNENLIRDEFKGLAGLFRRHKAEYFSNAPDFKELSMGMSNDYKTAIEEGSTMVRIGSLIFGER